MSELTQQYVQSLFNYKDGNLFYKKSPNRNIKIDSKAGTLNKVTGYYSIKINYKPYLTHRLIYFYHNGYFPKQIDHIDNNKSNNKIENLRKVTQSQNLMNSKSRKNSSSIYKGVSWYKPLQKWVAKIEINNKSQHLGYFKDEWCAAFIYNVYARGAFSEYAYLNDLGK